METANIINLIVIVMMDEKKEEEEEDIIFSNLRFCCRLKHSRLHHLREHLVTRICSWSILVLRTLKFWLSIFRVSIITAPIYWYSHSGTTGQSLRG